MFIYKNSIGAIALVLGQLLALDVAQAVKCGETKTVQAIANNKASGHETSLLSNSTKQKLCDKAYEDAKSNCEDKLKDEDTKDEVVLLERCEKDKDGYECTNKLSDWKVGEINFSGAQNVSYIDGPIPAQQCTVEVTCDTIGTVALKCADDAGGFCLNGISRDDDSSACTQIDDRSQIPSGEINASGAIEQESGRRFR